MNEFDFADHSSETTYINRQLTTANRFDNYREITAKFNTPAEKTQCGHPIRKGDLIGWSKRHGVFCQACWEKWSAENKEAEAIEAGFMPNVL